MSAFGIGGVLALIEGIVVLAIIGGVALLVCLVVANRVGVNITQVTDLSNVTDIRGKIGHFKTLLTSLRDVFVKMLDTLKSRIPVFSKIFTARGMCVVCFSFMLLFGVVPLRVTYGFSRVDFGILWLLQIALLIVFALVFAQKYFRFFIILMGTYFLLVFAGWPMRIFEYGGGDAFWYATQEYWNFSGIVLLLTLLVIMGVFFLTFFARRFQGTKLFIIACLIALPVNYLAMCVSYGGLLRNFILLFDCSFWMFIAFMVGVVCLVMSEKVDEQQ
jgi:hypothetical protein